MILDMIAHLDENSHRIFAELKSRKGYMRKVNAHRPPFLKMSFPIADFFGGG
jgi:hypothetical protein